MILKAFSVYDSAAQAFLQPFFVRSRGEAIRMFTVAANDAGHKFAQHASDFVLYGIGEFDDLTGTFTASTLESLGPALEYVQPGRPAVSLVDSQGDEEVTGA